MMMIILMIYVFLMLGCVWNMLVVLQVGNIVVCYVKLYFYDVFVIQELCCVDVGNEIVLLLEVEGMKVGLMICYDLCFLELVLVQVLQGVEILVFFVVWVCGLFKEYYWLMLFVVCVLDIICYMVVVGECGNKNIG